MTKIQYFTFYIFLFLVACSPKGNEKKVLLGNSDSINQNKAQKDNIVNNKMDSRHSAIAFPDTVVPKKTFPTKFKRPAGKPAIKTYSTANGGWGYNILIDGKLFIQQPIIPALNGSIPFKSEDDARKVAELMVFKINANISPPSVSIKELDSLHIHQF